MATPEQIESAKEIIAYYTLLASGTGAVPIPASSGAIIAQNGVMFGHIASTLGAEISVSTIVESIGIAGSLNIAGRTFFIEGAKLLSWGTGSVWALAALSVLGATTAGVQTYILGRIAIEIGKNDGKALVPSATSKIIESAKNSYDAFIIEWKNKKPKQPQGSGRSQT
ncbi:MAG: hypothetical protein AB3X44_04080 [Leptothrix sp. (in: b-proteobacteria)]